MRIELEETAVVRPSKMASERGAGSAGSTTMADRPLESSAEASASPTNPPPKTITSARSMRAALDRSSHRRHDFACPGSLRGGFYAKGCWGWENGERAGARTEARTG